MSDTALLVIAVGGIVLSILGALKCVSKISSFCCTIETRDTLDGTAQESVIQTNPLVANIIQKITPRATKKSAGTPTMSTTQPSQTPATPNAFLHPSDEVAMMV